MTNSFTYSVLQYRHSLVLGEAINVGILFQFPVEEKLKFVAGNAYRLKAIYPDFDQTVYNYLIKSIEKKLKEESKSLFRFANAKSDFKKFINAFILPEDATALQFKDPVSVLGNTDGAYNSDSLSKIVDGFSKMLLPGIITKMPGIQRHNEHFLIKSYIGYIFEKHKDLEKKINRNRVIKTEVHNSKIELKFELSWQNGATHFVKPLSFDLTEEKAILDKSLVNYGYLNLLGDFANQHDYHFDFIVSKPQNKELYTSYENALGLLQLSNAPIRIVTELELKDYSEETIEELLRH